MRPHSAAARHSHSFWFDLLGGATMAAPGGVPERPKGTGCKPVGSAYGGSNPPAPIIILLLRPLSWQPRGAYPSRGERASPQRSRGGGSTPSAAGSGAGGT